MTTHSWRTTAAAWTLATALAACPSVMAQGDADEASVSEEEEAGGLWMEAALWVAQPTGLDYTPATRINPLDPFDTQQQVITHGTSNRGRFRLGYEISRAVGEFVFTYYSHEDTEGLSGDRPGEFIFGETMAYPFHAGVFDDGLADHFDADTVTRVRDLRIDYYRHAFESERVAAKWFVGWRRVFHSRELTVSYFGLAPNLPPLLPPVTGTPRPLLVPEPDRAFQKSQYEGRGPEAGLDLLVDLWKNRIHLETGFAMAVLRGNFETDYTSTTHLYLLDQAGAVTVLAPPYDEFNDPLLVPSIQQASFSVGLKSGPVSADSALLEAYLGVRWRAWRTLEVFAGFRATRYDDVALELRPKQSTISLNGVVNLEDATRSVQSLGYEGFYGGLAYRF